MKNRFNSAAFGNWAASEGLLLLGTCSRRKRGGSTPPPLMSPPMLPTMPLPAHVHLQAQIRSNMATAGLLYAAGMNSNPTAADRMADVRASMAMAVFQAQAMAQGGAAIYQEAPTPKPI